MLKRFTRFTAEIKRKVRCLIFHGESQFAQQTCPEKDRCLHMLQNWIRHANFFISNFSSCIIDVRRSLVWKPKFCKKSMKWAHAKSHCFFFADTSQNIFEWDDNKIKWQSGEIKVGTPAEALQLAWKMPSLHRIWEIFRLTASDRRMELQVREAHTSPACLLLHQNQSNKSTTVYLIERKIFLAPRFFQATARLAHSAKFTRGHFALIPCFGAAGFDAESGKKWLAHFKDPNTAVVIFGSGFPPLVFREFGHFCFPVVKETGVWEFWAEKIEYELYYSPTLLYYKIRSCACYFQGSQITTIKTGFFISHDKFVKPKLAIP